MERHGERRDNVREAMGPDDWRPFASPGVLPVIVGAALWLLASWLFTRLIGAAWTECADIEAGGRFALVFLQLPLMMFSTFAAFGSTWLPLKRWPLLRASLPFVAALAAALVVVALSVPVGGDERWVGYDPAARTPDMEPTALCGPGGIPTWWPGWLPS